MYKWFKKEKNPNQVTYIGNTLEQNVAAYVVFSHTFYFWLRVKT